MQPGSLASFQKYSLWANHRIDFPQRFQIQKQGQIGHTCEAGFGVTLTAARTVTITEHYIY
jgi:hypothetical protein